MPDPQPHPTVPLMALEAAEAPAAVARQIQRNGADFAALGERLRRHPPRFVVTCARGSSDHASAYGKYLIETRLGLAVASIGPSVASVYGGHLNLEGALFIAVSQSGRSPDLLRLVEAAKAGGALVVGFVNAGETPLAALCDHCLPLSAGPERSVAATKSCIASLAAYLQLVVHWQQDAGLAATLADLPQTLERAAALDWRPALMPLAGATNLYVLGRGVGFGAALEMALKFKETCRLHAEAFSAAEVVHGPLALVGPGFPVLALTQADAAEPHTRAVVERIVGLGAAVATTETGLHGTVALPALPGLAPEAAPLAALQSFYGAVYDLALARGLDPDNPPNLAKVTKTV
ncbi:SIS domain-containing protein [Azospirillum picis]|uniref:Glucosamine--fructose-6-phosphate aminotransferase (Isomerizing) n=1 Tax=Azospirillum picis TaxID=488438 RepID=A0ABU0MMS4_9PROT|nr:SIS domain-containing protein [Azospirillum picis]MBP2300783.1 glucosamine--fructose-6-phosphate aminotransferase (isomerizing) [Azospirillum picis]MDQ0534752.1 glucosamine--fructose-6-phosphate aminotransferase (isomerizing) [Azospirillum picis]